MIKDDQSVFICHIDKISHNRDIAGRAIVIHAGTDDLGL